MARIGCICLPATGHINPLATLAMELVERGHEVLFFNVADFEESIRSRGLQFRLIAPLGFGQGAVAEREALMGGLMGLEASFRSNEYVLRYFEAFLSESVDAVEREHVDLLLVDQADFAGSVIAQALRVPFITMALCLLMNEDDGEAAPWNPVQQSDTDPARAYRRKTWQSLHRYMAKPFFACVNKHRQRLGLEPVKLVPPLWSTLAQISQEPAGFEFPRNSLPEYFHFTGPFHGAGSRPSVPFPYEQLNGSPLVYCSFGTMAKGDLGLLETIAEACIGLDMQLVVSLGGSPIDLPVLPGNPLTVRYAPQLELLERATMMVTHAGLNSTLECLSYGVPMVAVPLTIDQPAVAARIERCGAGVMVGFWEISREKMRSAIEEVLRNPDYRAAALRMKQQIADADGLRRAADIVEAVARGEDTVAPRTAASLA